MPAIAQLSPRLPILNHIVHALLAWRANQRSHVVEHPQKNACLPSELASIASKPYPRRNQNAFMWGFVGVFSLNHPRKQAKTPSNPTQNHPATPLKPHAAAPNTPFSCLSSSLPLSVLHRSSFIVHRSSFIVLPHCTHNPFDSPLPFHYNILIRRRPIGASHLLKPEVIHV
jgi:hypothetical protein